MVDEARASKEHAEGAGSTGAADASALPADITRALRDAFGDAKVEDISILKGGRSGATLLSLTVGGQGYVLRRGLGPMGKASEIACMKIASERGVAPKLRYLDEAAGVSIMERINVAPLDLAPALRARRIELVASTLRRLHEGPAFPRGMSMAALVRKIDEGARAHGPDGIPEELLRTLDELTTVTRRYAEAAPCHRDLNPGNILQTEDAVYFVDWEIACQSDPFLDLAQLGVFGFSTPDERARLLEVYLARRPSEEDLARATVARVMALGVYAASFVYVSAASGGPVRLTAAPLPMPEMLTLLRDARERAPADVVAASLLEEMRRAAETDAFEAARRFLTLRA